MAMDSSARRTLNDDEVALLREVLARHRPDLVSLVPRAHLNALARDDRLAVLRAIMGEYIETGIGTDRWDPNARGRRLEALADVIVGPGLDA